MSKFKVLYDFTGADAVELTVSQGEIVSTSGPLNASEEWALVQKTSPPNAQGYVPAKYLSPVADSPKASPAVADGSNLLANDNKAASPGRQSPLQGNAYTASTGGNEPLTISSLGRTSPLSSSKAAVGAYSTSKNSPPSYTPNTYTAPAAAGLPSTPSYLSQPDPTKGLLNGTPVQHTPAGKVATPSLNTYTPMATASPRANGASGVGSESFSDMFARHEQYFQQIMKQREETFQKLETSISTAAKEIAVCQDKNTRLTQRIMDLDRMIDDERARWTQRLEREKPSALAGTMSLN